MPPKPKKPHSLAEALLGNVPHQFSVPYLRNNFQFLSFTFLLIVVNVGLFLGRLWSFWNFKNSDGATSNVWLILAKATGGFDILMT